MKYSSVVSNHAVLTEPFARNGVTFTFRRLSDTKRAELRRSKEYLDSIPKIIAGQSGIASVREEAGLSDVQIADMEKYVRAAKLTTVLREADNAVAAGHVETADELKFRAQVTDVLNRIGRNDVPADNELVKHNEQQLEKLRLAEMPYREMLDDAHQCHIRPANIRCCLVKINGLTIEDADDDGNIVVFAGKEITADILLKFGPANLTAEIGDVIISENVLSAEEKENLQQPTTSGPVVDGLTNATIAEPVKTTDTTQPETAPKNSQN